MRFLLMVRALFFHSAEMARILTSYRKILWAITKVELDKRYSGSAFGRVWVVLYPVLLLSIYLFVYMVVFKMRLEGKTELDYVLFVFAGLIPYLGFSEAITAGAVSIKQNMHLVKNVMLPIELVPVKIVAVSMVTQLVSMAILLVLAGFNGDLSVHLLWLPLALGLQVMFTLGVVWTLSAVCVALPDVSYFVNLSTLLLIFISPIGFTPEMIPPKMRLIVYLNPIHYMIEMYRASVISGSLPQMRDIAIYVTLCLAAFAIGGAFFRKFKMVFVDYE